jgi:hypothetical protein
MTTERGTAPVYAVGEDVWLRPPGCRVWCVSGNASAAPEAMPLALGTVVGKRERADGVTYLVRFGYCSHTQFLALAPPDAIEATA